MSSGAGCWSVWRCGGRASCRSITSLVGACDFLSELQLQQWWHLPIGVARQSVRAVDGAQHSVVPFLVAARSDQSNADDGAIGAGSHIDVGGRVAWDITVKNDVRANQCNDTVDVA